MSRVRVAPTGAAILALALSNIVFTGSSPVTAADGQPVILGEYNEQTSPTDIYNSGWGPGLWVMSTEAGRYGIFGGGPAVGVEGYAYEGGTGILGTHSGTTGIGVHGQTGGVGSAVYGEATGDGVALNSETSTGVGVRAKSTSGNALEVLGKATFSRSGTVTVAAGTAAKTVSLAGVTTGSMVFATAQQNAAVFVKAVVPASGSFSIRLTGQAPTGGLKVAYFVLN